MAGLEDNRIGSAAPVGKPEARVRGIRVALSRCRIDSPGVTCSAPGILLQDARLADWASLVSRKDSRLLRVPPPAPHDRETVPAARKPQARARGIRVASRRCRIGSPGVACSAPGILLQDARLADWASLVRRKHSRLLRVPPPAPHDRESGGSPVAVASRQEAPSASAGYTGRPEPVPDWFAGGGMLSSPSGPVSSPRWCG